MTFNGTTSELGTDTCLQTAVSLRQPVVAALILFSVAIFRGHRPIIKKGRSFFVRRIGAVANEVRQFLAFHVRLSSLLGSTAARETGVMIIDFAHRRRFLKESAGKNFVPDWIMADKWTVANTGYVFLTLPNDGIIPQKGS